MGISEIKCWTRLELDNGDYITVKRLSTNRDLVSKVVGEELELVSRKKEFPHLNQDIHSIWYHSHLIYPIMG